jgi:glycerol-1-phosphate dehydrogenase [NAD(P)+]
VPLLARMVPSPLNVHVRRGAIGQLAELLADQRISAHGRVAVAVGPTLGDAIVEKIRPTLSDATVYRVSDGSVDDAQELAGVLRAGWYDAVVGIGGGRTLDVAKFAASQAALPMVAVATSLAHDGLASPVSSLEHRGRKGSYGVHIPIAVIVDLDYVHQCPLEQLRAGVGDAISNLNAVADWELAMRERGEPFDGIAAALARVAAESVLHRTDELTSDSFLQALAEALVLGGLAIAAAGSSRPCSGACHEIAHALDALYPGCALHGQQVAVGAMFASYVRNDARLGEVDACLRRLEVARVPADIGLNEEQFAAAVAHAPATRPDRYTILEHVAMGDDEIRSRVHEFVGTFDR